MNANRLKILQMLAAGQITTDEAERLIAALEKEQPGSTAGETTESRPAAAPKYLRVVVDDHPNKVNIRVPMQWLRAGVRLVNLIPPPARARVNEALRRDGVPFDLSQIKPDNLEDLI